MRALFLGSSSSVTESSTVRGRAALGTAAVVALVGSLLALAALGFPLIGVDDANIIFVYARNLLHGAGFVYTPGFERVEGFTSLLWTVVSALIQALSTGRHELVTLAVSLLLTGVTIWCVLRTVFEVTRAPGARAAAALFLLGQASFFAWSFATLMDLALWSTLLALGVRAVLAPGLELGRRGQRLSLVVALMVLTRPEALLVGPALVALAAFQAFQGGVPISRIARGLALPVVAFAVVSVGLTAFRSSYFGFPLPNTYYAKVSGDRLYNLLEGAKYVGRYFRAFPPRLLFLVPLAYGVVDLLRPRAQRVLDASTRGVVLVLVLGLLLPLFGGGDHFAEHRFLVPFLPWFALPLAELVARANSGAGAGLGLLRDAGLMRGLGCASAGSAASSARSDSPAPKVQEIEPRSSGVTCGQAAARRRRESEELQRRAAPPEAGRGRWAWPLSPPAPVRPSPRYRGRAPASSARGRSGSPGRRARRRLKAPGHLREQREAALQVLDPAQDPPDEVHVEDAGIAPAAARAARSASIASVHVLQRRCACALPRSGEQRGDAARRRDRAAEDRLGDALVDELHRLDGDLGPLPASNVGPAPLDRQRVFGHPTTSPGAAAHRGGRG